jgi:hypothetical protein
MEREKSPKAIGLYYVAIRAGSPWNADGATSSNDIASASTGAVGV